MNFRKIIIISFAIISVVILAFFIKNISGESNLNNVDKNSNGIWDDIEPFIKKKSITEFHRKALEQYFKVFQKNLMNPERCIEIKNKTITDDVIKSLTCRRLIEELYGGTIESSETQDAIINTIARARAYNKYLSYCSGGFFGTWNEVKQGPPCEFEVK